MILKAAEGDLPTDDAPAIQPEQRRKKREGDIARIAVECERQDEEL